MSPQEPRGSHNLLQRCSLILPDLGISGRGGGRCSSLAHQTKGCVAGCGSPRSCLLPLLLWVKESEDYLVALSPLLGEMLITWVATMFTKARESCRRDWQKYSTGWQNGNCHTTEMNSLCPLQSKNKGNTMHQEGGTSLVQQTKGCGN